MEEGARTYVTGNLLFLPSRRSGIHHGIVIAITSGGGINLGPFCLSFSAGTSGGIGTDRRMSQW
jgi:hypothetical protein